MSNIVYTAGSHGNFIKYLFDCYEDEKLLLDNPFNKNGNSHNQKNSQNNKVYDFCNSTMFENFKKQSETTHENYAIIWKSTEEFYYILQCYTDRGGTLTTSGISLIEENLIEYEKIYGVDVTISSVLKKYFNFDCVTQGQPPRNVLRNYFLLSFFTYFEHTCWKNNKELAQTDYKKITLDEIWNYNSLQKKLFEFFNKNLNFKHIHEQFLDKNIPFKQLNQANIILNSIEKKENIKICKLNIISEAYILFVLEYKYFDIPFLLGNSFFNNTQEIVEYIEYFPTHMKKPNNLFHIHYTHFARGKNVVL